MIIGYDICENNIVQRRRLFRVAVDEVPPFKMLEYRMANCRPILAVFVRKDKAYLRGSPNPISPWLLALVPFRRHRSRAAVYLAGYRPSAM